MTAWSNSSPVLVTEGGQAHRPGHVGAFCGSIGQFQRMTLIQAEVWVRPAFVCPSCWPGGAPRQPLHASGGVRR